ncbi:hypothetical protein R83H12_00912 [Fibrobacteria bacterium R8-3-H12]
MRNKLYKISTAILVLAIAFTLSIIACGGDKGTNSDPEDPSSSSVSGVNPSSSSEAVQQPSSSSNEVIVVPSSSSNGNVQISSSSAAVVEPSSSSEAELSSSSAGNQVDPALVACINEALEDTESNNNVRFVWRACTNNPDATGAESVEGFWSVIVDENGKYGDCEKSTLTAAFLVRQLKTACNVR